MFVPSFFSFLDAKPLYYNKIDHNRIKVAYALLEEHIKHPRTVHIIGTNGKGSTGRIIAHLAYSSGLTVGHFSSPHIVKFNERLWIDGEDSSDKLLEVSHQRLYAILGQEISEALSYFEYTTLLAFVAFENVDLMVLEAGLGGEWDATSVGSRELSVITPIGIDHQAFLGDTIEQIASTKIRSIQKKALLAPQVYDEVSTIAFDIAQKQGATLHYAIDSYKEEIVLNSIDKLNNWSDYLVDNCAVGLQALDILDIKFDINSLLSLKLFGRFYLLEENIRIDVGHNQLAANAIVKALDREIVLIYNSLDDKDYRAILGTLKPKVKRVEIIEVPSSRAVTIEKIEDALDTLSIDYSPFKGDIKSYENYLVFGSFYVVEEFLKNYQS